MSTQCPFCFSILKRDNPYGTICCKCYNYIEPKEKPKLVQENEEKLKNNQEIIRSFLRGKILGEKDGD